jgi:Na+-transporting NADH:ubiquinone oxidoreductase subunit NqrC
MDNSSPQLIDNTAKYYLFSTLQKCHMTKTQMYNMSLNIIVFIVFVGVVAGVLYYCSKKKLTPEQLQQKMIRDQNYVLSKIRYYQQENNAKKTSDITNLPSF